VPQRGRVTALRRADAFGPRSGLFCTTVDAPDRSSESTDLLRYVTDEATEELGVFMGTVAGSASIQLGELAGDEVKFWRFKRSLKHAQKAKKMLDTAGLKPHQVPFRTLVPLVEGGSLEDDEHMTEKWAALLANAAGGESNVPPSFPSVLRELEPTEARLLDVVYDSMMSLGPDFRRKYGVERESLARDGFSVTEAEFQYHVDNLVRLRLIRGMELLSQDEFAAIGLTEFGRAFVRACRPPSAPDPPIAWSEEEPLLAHIAQRSRAAAEESAAAANAAALDAEVATGSGTSQAAEQA
jgi:hypothetical protein